MDDMIIARLAGSAEPSIRYILEKEYFGVDPSLPGMIALREEIRTSDRVCAMLADRQADGSLPVHAYSKWKGAFWTLLQLSDLGYPENDQTLIPLREQICSWLLDPERLNAVPQINGRWRRCALQEGGAVLALESLGLADERVTHLVELLLKWQWEDGGWNCDKNPSACHSSFNESLIPLRGLNAYARVSGDPQVKAAVERTTELLLDHRLYKHHDRDAILTPRFTELAFPPYWHYDFLSGLIAMQEVGALHDPRCTDALDLLESMRLPDGGIAAQRSYYRVSKRYATGLSAVAWGMVSKTQSNDWLTARSVGILRQAGRIRLPDAHGT